MNLKAKETPEAEHYPLLFADYLRLHIESYAQTENCTRCPSSEKKAPASV